MKNHYNLSSHHLIPSDPPPPYRLHHLRQNSKLDFLQNCDLAQETFFSQFSTSKQIKAKVFRNGRKGLLEIFSIQLLDLCIAQLQIPTSQTKHLSALQQLISSQQFEIPAQITDGILYNCSQKNLKSLFHQFIEHIKQSNPKGKVLSYLNRFPLILCLLRAVLQQLLFLGDVYQEQDQFQFLTLESIFDFLASYFGIQASIDLENRCIYFQGTKTWVYEQSKNISYMIKQFSIRRTDVDEKTEVWKSAQSVKSDRKSQFSQIDIEEFSSILNNNQYFNEDLHSGRVIISNLEIQPQVKKQPKNSIEAYFQMDFKIAQSFLHQESAFAQTSVPKYNENENGKGSITTTYSVFKHSSSQNIKDSIKTYIETPSILKSQFLQTQDCFYSLQKAETSLPTKGERKNDQIEISRVEFSSNYPSPFRNFYINTTESFHKKQSSNLLREIEEGKKPIGWVNKNISKEFTNSFLLQKVSEPYRSSIKQKKARAREQRKHIQSFFQYYQ